MNDVQISTDNQLPTRQEANVLWQTLHNFGVKCRDGIVLDGKVPRGLIVLWVGAVGPPQRLPENKYPPVSPTAEMIEWNW
jgi:hypothetical protein